MLWTEKLLQDLPEPNRFGWLADVDADWWRDLREFFAALGPFDNTFDATFE